MPLLLCDRCARPIASVHERFRALVGASLCLRCSHPAYYRGRPPYERARAPAMR